MLRKIRDMFFLNNAATTYPKPSGVIAAVSDCLRTAPLERARGSGTGPDRVDSCRRTIAAFINAADPGEIVFTSGATESLNLAIRGLGLNGRHVVTTAVEHTSVLRPLHTLRHENLISLTVVPCDRDGKVTPAEIVSAVTGDTALVVVNHCSNVSGHVIDTAEVAAKVHACGGYLLVDASQSIGAQNFDIREIKADMVAFGAHKNLFGIPGVGCLYLRPGIELTPLKTGGTGIRSDLLTQPAERPLRYEAGTVNLPALAALEAGVDFVTSTGLSEIRRKREEQFRFMVRSLKEVPGVVLYGGGEARDRSPILNVTLEGMDPSETAYILENSFDIIVRSGLHCAPLIHQYLGTYPKGTIRASVSYLTPDEAVEAFVSAIRDVSRMCKRTGGTMA